MSHNDYDPAKKAGETNWKSEPKFDPSGPSGNETLIDHNEKAILETFLHGVPHKDSSALKKESGHRQGVYGENGA